jgi:hypothetical protein
MYFVFNAHGTQEITFFHAERFLKCRKKCGLLPSPLVEGQPGWYPCPFQIADGQACGRAMTPVGRGLMPTCSIEDPDGRHNDSEGEVDDEEREGFEEGGDEGGDEGGGAAEQEEGHELESGSGGGDTKLDE